MLFRSPIEAEAKADINKRYGQLPMRFEENRGQTDQAVKYVTRGDGYSLFLTANEVVWRLRKARKESGDVGAGEEGNPESEIRNPKPKVRNSKPETRNLTSALLRMRLVGANPEPTVVGVEPLPTKSNYFIGNAPQSWRTGVANFARVQVWNSFVRSLLQRYSLTPPPQLTDDGELPPLSRKHAAQTWNHNAHETEGDQPLNPVPPPRSITPE